MLVVEHRRMNRIDGRVVRRTPIVGRASAA
jgi:hypothetical protein